jgi:hypothetical protein
LWRSGNWNPTRIGGILGQPRNGRADGTPVAHAEHGSHATAAGFPVLLANAVISGIDDFTLAGNTAVGEELPAIADRQADIAG